MRNTIGQVLEEIETLTKQAFIPNPAMSQGGQPAQGGQGGGEGQAKLQQILQSLPPDVQKQVAQYLQQSGGTLDDAAMGQIADQLQQQGGQPAAGGDQGAGTNTQAQDPNAQQDPNTQAQAAKPGAGGEVQGSAPPTDLEKSTITLRVIDLIDLTSGGKGTHSALKVKDHIDKAQERKQMHQQKMQQQQQQQEQEAQMQQQQPGMLGQGGIY